MTTIAPRPRLQGAFLRRWAVRCIACLQRPVFWHAAALVLLFGLSSAFRRAQARPAPYGVSVLSSMVKVRRDEHRTAERDLSVQLHVARGEAESVQILVQADEALQGVTVTSAPLRGPQGALLPLEILQVGYVPIKHPTPVGFGKPGPYPDPLLPLRPFDVQAGESQSLWVTAWVPREAAAGDYRGEITIAPAAAPPRTVPVQVRVFTATLPVQGTLRTHFESWNGGNSDDWYGKAGWDELKPRFRDTMLRYRISFTPDLPWASIYRQAADGTWSAEWTEFDRVVESWLAKGVNFFMIRRQFLPHFGGREVPAFVVDPDDAGARLRLLGAHLEEKGWSTRFAFYLFDEIIFSDNCPKPGDRIGAANITNIQSIARQIHDYAPNLKVLITACDPAYEAVAMEFPAYVWCPHINHFHAEFQQRRQKLGEPNWMYVCMTTWRQKYPDIWRIDREGVSHRAIGAWLWQYRCDGFLFWCVDYWRKNPYETPDIFAKGVNGDGFLFYPDPEKRADPFPSIRLALTRDAFEDYELLSLLQQAVTACQAQGGSSATRHAWLAGAERLLDLGQVIPSLIRFSEDPSVYETRHREILELLQELSPEPMEKQ